MKAKRRFIVNARQHSTKNWTYTVEADTKKDAIDKVIDGEVERNNDQTTDLGHVKYIAFLDDEPDPQ